MEYHSWISPSWWIGFPVSLPSAGRRGPRSRRSSALWAGSKLRPAARAASRPADRGWKNGGKTCWKMLVEVAKTMDFSMVFLSQAGLPMDDSNLNGTSGSGNPWMIWGVQPWLRTPTRRTHHSAAFLHSLQGVFIHRDHLTWWVDGNWQSSRACHDSWMVNELLMNVYSWVVNECLSMVSNEI